MGFDADVMLIQWDLNGSIMWIQAAMFDGLMDCL
jgi:hypothetical protein